MYLKYLELSGFKSFPDKTRLTFGRGITAVVGPNGSGKSNISDAVRWVFGEQSTKALRGSKMEDVIFNGSAIRHAHGFAEVKLALDNTDRSLAIDQDEVVISRKYFRNGESEYRICDNSARLRDVNELFMDTGLGRDGYSLIGQGRISEIVNAKPIQRREIFEEASGISKFRYKKEEAERNLEKADENLLRLRDNLTALEERVGPLLEQSKKAKQFIELAEEKKTLEISVWVRTLHHLKNQLREQNDTILSMQSEYDSINNAYLEAEEHINSISEDLKNIDIDIENKRNTVSQNNSAVSDYSLRSAVCSSDIEHNRQTIDRLESEVNELSNDSDASVIDSKRNEVEKKTSDYNAILDEVSSLKANADKIAAEKDELENRKSEIEKNISQIDAEIGHINVVLATSENDSAQYRERIDQLNLSAESKLSALSQYEDSLKNVRDLIEAINDKLDSLNNTKTGLNLKRSMKLGSLTAIEDKRTKLEREAESYKFKAKTLEDLEKNMDGFSQSVKFILDKGSEGRLRGILDPVSKIISVDPKYSLAVETSASSALQNIVVTDEDAAKTAIALLKSEGKGRVTFLPVTSVKGNKLDEPGLASCDGFLGIASDIVKYDKKYEGIIRSIFGRTAVTEDLDSAVSIARKYGYKFRIVTLDGQLVNAGGSLTGGSSVKSAGLLSRKQEIENLCSKADAIAKQLENGNAEYVALKQEISSLDAKILAFDSEFRTAEEDKIRAEEEKKHIEQHIQDARSAGAEVESQKAILEKSIKEAESRFSEFTAIKNDKSSARESLLSDISGIDAKLSDNSVSATHNNDNIVSLNMKAALARQSIENLNDALEHLLQSHDERVNKIASINEEISSLKGSNDSLLTEISDIASHIDSLNTSSESLSRNVEELYTKRKELELRSTQERNSQKELVNQREESSNNLTRSRSRYEDMQKDYDSTMTQLWDEYEMTYSMAEDAAIEITEPAKAQKRLNELKSKIKSLGSVNVDAIDEYREVNERYEFMKSQIQDAESSRDELRNLIHNLMGQMRTIFTDRFTLIAANFAVVFRDLFGGGEAKLQLTDSDDVLESGIDIIAHPPGKIINNLSSLSGGEQTLIAIAIYFAILKVRPAPFCILDEIEAALDESNVDKYAEYMLTLTSDTQFIAITHRRGTMEHSDRLYGVTMQEEGVSKLLELTLADVDKIEK